REPDRPLQRWMIARGRSASLPLSYTTTRDTTDVGVSKRTEGQFGLKLVYYQGLYAGVVVNEQFAD
ncbi:hypothetical protein, partial [Sphingomonas sp. BK481]|uniref:hypothetical protein n=1 Tax=Sphingomonas sp. BK481 TaxID=2586981 RepID=UPI001C847EDB